MPCLLQTLLFLFLMTGALLAESLAPTPVATLASRAGYWRGTLIENDVTKDVSLSLNLNYENNDIETPYRALGRILIWQLYHEEICTFDVHFREPAFHDLKSSCYLETPLDEITIHFDDARRTISVTMKREDRLLTATLERLKILHRPNDLSGDWLAGDSGTTCELHIRSLPAPDLFGQINYATLDIYGANFGRFGIVLGSIVPYDGGKLSFSYNQTGSTLYAGQLDAEQRTMEGQSRSEPGCGTYRLQPNP